MKIIYTKINSRIKSESFPWLKLTYEKQQLSSQEVRISQSSSGFDNNRKQIPERLYFAVLIKQLNPELTLVQYSSLTTPFTLSSISLMKTLQMVGHFFFQSYFNFKSTKGYFGAHLGIWHRVVLKFHSNTLKKYPEEAFMSRGWQ